MPLQICRLHEFKKQKPHKLTSDTVWAPYGSGQGGRGGREATHEWGTVCAQVGAEGGGGAKAALQPSSYSHISFFSFPTSALFPEFESLKLPKTHPIFN